MGSKQCKSAQNKNVENPNGNQRSEDFIIKLHRQQKRHGIIHNSKELLSDPRRVVFVSLIGLYQTWSMCPSPILYSAIFILPIKKKWIYFPKKYQHEINENSLGNMTLFRDKIMFQQFLSLLKWKDSQGLLFCMLGTDQITHSDDLFAPFWRHFSEVLSNLYDPITKSKYNPIKLSTKWWQYSFNTFIPSKYAVKAPNVLNELYFVTMKFKVMQEIIFQSNPNSLKPIFSYIPDITLHKKDDTAMMKGFVGLRKKPEFNGFVCFEQNCCPDMDESDEEQNDNGGTWMISSDYNEYDLA